MFTGYPTAHVFSDTPSPLPNYLDHNGKSNSSSIHTSSTADSAYSPEPTPDSTLRQGHSMSKLDGLFSFSLGESSPSCPGHLVVLDSRKQEPTVNHINPLAGGGTRLRQLLEDPNHLIVCPGVYDGLSARIAISMGFEAVYMTGAGTSLSRLGMADLAIATFNDMHENANMIAGLDRTIPLVADADTGYGGPIMNSRTAEAYARSGVAAMHIEDQAQEKRCGHLAGKLIVPTEVWLSRIRAAVNARNRIGSDMLIIARTDARQGLGYEEAVRRLEKAVDVGADIVLLEGILTKDEGRDLCALMKTKGNRPGGVPCLLNMVAGGVSPQITVEEAQEMGYRIMIFSTLAFEGAIKGIKNAFADFQRTGVQTLSKGAGVREAFKLAGLDELMKIDDEAGGMSLKAA